MRMLLSIKVSYTTMASRLIVLYHTAVFFDSKTRRPRSSRRSENRDDRMNVISPRRESFLSLGLQNVRSLNAPGRLASVLSEIRSAEMDIFCATEMWLRDCDVFHDTDLFLAGYNYHSQSRPDGQRGGGLMIMHKSVFCLKPISLPTLETFEQLTAEVSLSNDLLITISVIYLSSA